MLATIRVEVVYVLRAWSKLARISFPWGFWSFVLVQCHDFNPWQVTTWQTQLWTLRITTRGRWGARPKRRKMKKSALSHKTTWAGFRCVYRLYGLFCIGTGIRLGTNHAMCVCFIRMCANQQVVKMGMTKRFLLGSYNICLDLIHGLWSIPCVPM